MARRELMSGDIDILRNIYDRFNARDIDAVLADDVAWANGMEGATEQSESPCKRDAPIAQHHSERSNLISTLLHCRRGPVLARPRNFSHMQKRVWSLGVMQTRFAHVVFFA
jgi:hypothetical protein